MTIGQFILFLMKYNLQEIVELFSVKRDKGMLILKLKGLPPTQALEEQDRMFLSGLGIAM